MSLRAAIGKGKIVTRQKGISRMDDE